MGARELLSKRRELPLGEPMRQRYSFGAKTCLTFMITSSLLFISWTYQAHGDIYPFPGSYTINRLTFTLFGLTPPEVFAVVGCVLGILEVIFLIALVRTRKKIWK
jgi:hypothetical protein